MSLVNSNNDWDPLEEIIVGRADHARIPTVDRSTMAFSYADRKIEEIRELEGPYPQWIINEANEDLDRLSDELAKLGVKVRRPLPVDHGKKFSTPDWESTGWYSYCPRDLLLPLKGQIIECPASMRARYFETKIYEPLLYEYFESGTKWISAPKPRLLDETFTFDDLRRPTLRNTEIIFDAPNVLRLGRDLLFQISNSGNHLGAKWLQSVVGSEYRVHVAEHIYSFAHLDSTIVPLRPGLVLLNASRVNPGNCPELFAKWDKIYFDDVVEIKSHLPNGISPCSPYIGLNFLSVNEKLVIVDENQEPLRMELSRWGIESMGLKMRHSRTLSGGFHCVTLDVRRKGGLESYCD
jgi:N-dimethylarginine dimethylaminohydrolase